ncbi:MAG: addiction module protein [Nitrospirae bacterium]|nr:addiction module protein [Nitrospirota bacterium]MBF0540008.1 addiction module protein [Nitrospirota bacterium]
MMAKEILEQALKLKPKEKFEVVNYILKSLDNLDHNIGEIWAEEAEKRLIANRNGRLNGISMEKIL